MIDLSGRRFTRLLVLARSGSRGTGDLTWSCLCDCGRAVVVRGSCLRRGDTRSCGCLQRERAAWMGRQNRGRRLTAMQGKVMGHGRVA